MCRGVRCAVARRVVDRREAAGPAYPVGTEPILIDIVDEAAKGSEAADLLMMGSCRLRRGSCMGRWVGTCRHVAVSKSRARALRLASLIALIVAALAPIALAATPVVPGPPPRPTISTRCSRSRCARTRVCGRWRRVYRPSTAVPQAGALPDPTADLPIPGGAAGATRRRPRRWRTGSSWSRCSPSRASRV